MIWWKKNQFLSIVFVLEKKSFFIAVSLIRTVWKKWINIKDCWKIGEAKTCSDLKIGCRYQNPKSKNNGKVEIRTYKHDGASCANVARIFDRFDGEMTNRCRDGKSKNFGLKNKEKRKKQGYIDITLKAIIWAASVLEKKTVCKREMITGFMSESWDQTITKAYDILTREKKSTSIRRWLILLSHCNYEVWSERRNQNRQKTCWKLLVRAHALFKTPIYTQVVPVLYFCGAHILFFSFSFVFCSPFLPSSSFEPSHLRCRWNHISSFLLMKLDIIIIIINRMGQKWDSFLCYSCCCWSWIVTRYRPIKFT